MTPLPGTKNPSAPVGDKSGGGSRAARAAAFQVFTKHEARDPSHGYCLPRGVSQREFPGFHETRNTRHESRLFFESHESRLFFESRPFCRVGRQVMREGGRSAGFKGGCTKRGKTSGKRFFLNPETGITTFSESGFSSRFGIPHYSSEFVAKIRISPCRPSSAPEHCGNLQSVGKVPWYEGKSAAGSWGCSAWSEEDGDPGDLLLAKEKRATKPTGLGGRCEEKAWSRWAASSEPPLEQKNVRRPKGAKKKYAPLPVNGTEGAAPYSWNDQVLFHLPPARNAARVTFTTGCRHRLHGCIASPRNLPWPAGLAKWRGKGRTGHESGLSRLSLVTSHCFYAFDETETRDTKQGFRRGARRKPAQVPRFSRNTRHETRITALMLPYPRFPTISHDFPAFPGISRPPPTPPIKCPGAVRRSRSASRRALLVGNPTKVHKIPVPAGKCAKHSVRRESRRPPGLSRCGERNMNPC